MSNLPQWLQFLLAALTGAVLGVGAVVRTLWTLDKRIHRIENQDLDQMIDARIEAWSDRRNLVRQEQIDARISHDWHENRYPMLQVRVFGELDKIEEELKKQGQNIAILLERDRIMQAIDKVATMIIARLPPP